jgi:hypothetical protein
LNLVSNEIIKEPEPIVVPDLIKKTSQKAKPKFDLSINTEETTNQDTKQHPQTVTAVAKPLEITDNFEHLKTQASYI